MEWINKPSSESMATGNYEPSGVCVIRVCGDKHNCSDLFCVGLWCNTNE